MEEEWQETRTIVLSDDGAEAVEDDDGPSADAPDRSPCGEMRGAPASVDVASASPC